MAKEIGKDLVKTLAIWPLRQSNVSVPCDPPKPLQFRNVQHHGNTTTMPPVGTQARLRAWLGLNPVQVQVLSPALLDEIPLCRKALDPPLCEKPT